MLALGLGIGANTAIFCVVYGVLLQPLPFPQSSRLVNVWESDEKRNLPKLVGAPANYYDWRTMNTGFSAIGAYQQNNFNLLGAAEPDPFPGAICDPGSSPRWASRPWSAAPSTNPTVSRGRMKWCCSGMAYGRPASAMPPFWARLSN